MKYSRGYTLVELIVAVGLFAIVLTLAGGAYLMMIGYGRQAQGIATNTDSLSFALEHMTRTIRTGTAYDCAGLGDCPAGGSSFSLTSSDGAELTYSASDGAVIETRDGIARPLTDPAVVVSSLVFYATGSDGMSEGDYRQPYVTIILSGTIGTGAGKSESFTIETSAAMRGTDF